MYNRTTALRQSFQMYFVLDAGPEPSQKPPLPKVTVSVSLPPHFRRFVPWRRMHAKRVGIPPGTPLFKEVMHAHGNASGERTGPGGAVVAAS